MENDKCDVVETWINNVAFSHSNCSGTAKLYKNALNDFTTWLGVQPEAIVKEYEITDEKLFKRKYGSYLRSYISHLSKKGYANMTIHNFVAIVKSFFKYNDLPLSFLPTGRLIVTYHNRDISKEEIEAVLSISDVRERAFYIMMVQSGLRPDTLCKLTLKDIESDFSKGVIPCKIDIPQNKTKGQFDKYFSFMAEEGVAALKAYLNTRSDLKSNSYLFVKIKRGNVEAKQSEVKISPNTMSNCFRVALRKLRDTHVIDYEIRVRNTEKETDKKKRRRTGRPNELRLYTLRKYFKNHANQIGSEYCEFLMGHIVKGSAGNYIAKDVEFYRQLYKEKAMPFLRIGSNTPSEIEKEVEKIRDETKGEIEAMNKTIEWLSAENKLLKEQKDDRAEMWDMLKTISAENKELKEKYEMLSKKVEKT